MPAKAQWLPRLPRIIQEISALKSPVVDRGVIEIVFRVKRRRAIELMKHFGSAQGPQSAGQSLVLDRADLLRQLTAIEHGADYYHEHHRREKMAEQIERSRRDAAAAKVQATMPVSVMSTRLAELPEGVTLEPGLLKIEFHKPVELVERLFALAQALANDYERFEKIIAPSPSG